MNIKQKVISFYYKKNEKRISDSKKPTKILSN